MSAFLVVPGALLAPASSAAVAADLLSGVAPALRSFAADTGRPDSAKAVWTLVRALTDQADLLARDSAADADAVRAAASTYTAVERRAMEP